MNEWQTAGCPDLPQHRDDWQHAGDTVLEVLDQVEARMERADAPAPDTGQPDLLAPDLETDHQLLLRLLRCCDESSLNRRQVADVLLRTVVCWVLYEDGSSWELDPKLRARVSVDTLRHHFAAMAARVSRE